MNIPHIIFSAVTVLASSLSLVFLLFLLLMAPGRRSRRAKKYIPNVFYAHRGLFGEDIPEN
mgnify:CR=1 FL=1